MELMNTSDIETAPEHAYTRRVAGKPKPPSQVKSRVVQVRLTAKQYREIARAADAAGLALGTWMRTISLRECARLAKPEKEPQ
jgi:hypothetical protein